MDKKSTQPFFSKKINAKNLACFDLIETEYLPASKMFRHAHEPAHISLVVKGSYTEQYEQKSRYVQSSFLIIHPAHESHSVQFDDAGARILNIQIKENWVESIYPYSKILEEPAEFDNGIISSLARRIYKEFRQADKFWSLAVDGLMLEVIAEISRRKTSTERVIPDWLKRVKEILHEEFNKKLDFAEIARAVEIHPVYLARQFHHFYYCTMSDYVRRRRIEYACREIIKTDVSLSDIALQAGFYDQSHFANAFKEFIGITPAQYRAAFQ